LERSQQAGSFAWTQSLQAPTAISPYCKLDLLDAPKTLRSSPIRQSSVGKQYRSCRPFQEATECKHSSPLVPSIQPNVCLSNTSPRESRSVTWRKQFNGCVAGRILLLASSKNSSRFPSRKGRVLFTRPGNLFLGATTTQANHDGVRCSRISETRRMTNNDVTQYIARLRDGMSPRKERRKSKRGCRVALWSKGTPTIFNLMGPETTAG